MRFFRKKKTKNRIALFIDAENISRKYIPKIMDDIQSKGDVVIRRAYANWNTANQEWRNISLRYHIRPFQVFSVRKGKNAVDIALTIGVMDVINAHKCDIVALVSGDSDYAALVNRVQESGVKVLCYGTRDAVLPYRTASDAFIILDEKYETTESHCEASILIPNYDETMDKVISLIESMANNDCNEYGYVSLVELNKAIIHTMSGISLKKYGFKKIIQLIRFLKVYDIKPAKGGGYYGFKNMVNNQWIPETVIMSDEITNKESVEPNVLLKQLREEKGIGVYELAKQTSVAVPTLSRMEKGTLKIGEKTAEKLALFFGREKNDFITSDKINPK